MGDAKGGLSADFTTATNPAKPKKRHYTAKTKASVTVEWDSVPGANYYRMYKKVNGKFKQIATVKGNNNTSFTFGGLTPATKNPFKIAAVFRVGGVSISGATVDIKVLTRGK